MSNTDREKLMQWLPLIVAIVGPIVTQAVIYGAFTASTKADIEHLKAAHTALREEVMPMERRMSVFVPRAEFMVRMELLDGQINDLKALAKDTNVKMNAIYVRPQQQP